ncbi:MAG: APC family permease [Streptosporangiaceae bacterium]
MANADTRPSADSTSSRELHRTASWRSSALLAVAAALQITIAMGPMAGEVGNIQPLIWAFAAATGLVQCLFIAELATHFPHRSGGTATYAYEAFGGRNRWLPAVSGWGYWFAWTPGIAVNLILAASYLHATIAPHISTVVLSLTLGAALYALNARGLRINVRVTATLITLTALPLAALLMAPLVEPSLFHGGYVWPLHFPASHGAPAGLIIKWLFVAAWSAYGAEMGSTIFAECRASERTAVRGMAVAGTACLVGFTLVPLVMTGIVGAGRLGASPATVFLVPARAVLGGAGATIIGLMLAGALVAGAQAYIISSSRTLYQMSRDGYMPRMFQRVNRYGVPFNTVFCDAAVIALLVGIFGTNVVNVVAAANTGYLLVFVILPVGFVIVRRRRSQAGDALVMPRWMTPVALAFAAFNAVLLVAGAALWGPRIWLTGALVMSMVIPLTMLRARGEKRGQ